MAVPDSLPQRLYVLAHDPVKGRVHIGTNLGLMLRAAGLADLYLQGHLTDERGRAAASGRHPTGDPVLGALFDEIAGSRPRKWQSWVDRGHRPTIRAVREQLGEGGWARLEHRKVLGLFPMTKVTLRDPRVRKEVLSLLDAALKRPLGRVDFADAALVSIVAAGNLTLVLDRKAKRDGKRRLRELIGATGPVGPALRRAIQDSALGELA
ncbi:GOLPH3/VPS74 family protein [Actinoplanes sp. CA-131856]